MAVNSLTLVLVRIASFAALAAVAQGADDAQPLAPVQRAAEAALRRQIDPALAGVQLQAADLDPRLRLPACLQPLAASTPMPRGMQTRVLVRVACKAVAGWAINVPVDIHRQATVLVLQRAIARGEAIGAGDVSAQTRVLAGLGSPFVSNVSELAGRRARRTLPEGTAVTADALDAALLIHRGQSVTLTASGQGLAVQAPGIALADAQANQRVRVQNLNSLKIVEGVADSDGVVRVNP